MKNTAVLTIFLLNFRKRLFVIKKKKKKRVYNNKHIKDGEVLPRKEAKWMDCNYC